MSIIDKIFKKIEREIFACNRFNPIATLYLNFRCLRLRHALRFTVFVYGTPRFYSTYGEIILTGNVKTISECPFTNRHNRVWNSH